MHRGTRLFAIDRGQRRVAWSFDSSYRSRREEPLGPARPLRIGGKLYVRASVRGRSALACFDAAKGKLLWSQTYDDRVLSNPILIDAWLYVITARNAMAGALDLYLHRVSPETGESSLSSALGM